MYASPPSCPCDTLLCFTRKSEELAAVHKPGGYGHQYHMEGAEHTQPLKPNFVTWSMYKTEELLIPEAAAQVT